MRLPDIRAIIAALALLIALSLTVSMTMCSSNRVALAVDAFTLSKSTGITVGDGSDLCFDRIARDQLTVNYDADHNCWRWQVNAAASDTLPYYKVNNYNPNLHELDAGDKVEVKLGSRSFTLDKEQLIAAGVWAGHRSQYVRVADALRCVDSTLTADAVEAVHSIFYRTEANTGNAEHWRLIILDRATIIDHGGQRVGYTYTGSTGEIDVAGNEPDAFKVQFFNIERNTLEQPEDGGIVKTLSKWLGIDTDYFHMGTVNVTCKPTVCTTEWGAGHMTMRRDGNATRVSFPKPIMLVERIDTLRTWAAPFAGLLTLTQNSVAFPSPGAMIIPAFSSGVNTLVCNLWVDESGDITMKSAGSDARLDGGMGLCPQLQRHVIDCPGSGTVLMRAGVINGGFAFSYLWPILLLGALLIAAAWWVYGGDRFKHLSLSVQMLDGAWQQFAVVMAIAMTYCVAKSMIAFKLSYSYPYFEKITAILPASAMLMLVLVFAFSVLFNSSLVFISRKDAAPRVNRLVPGIVAIVTTALGLIACYLYLTLVLDVSVSPDVTGSFLADDIEGPVWSWHSKTALNDLHRTVPMTMLLIGGAVLVIQIALFVLNWLEADVFARVRQIAEDNPLYVTLGLIAIIAAVAAVNGNFATAFITILVVTSLTFTLRAIAANHERFTDKYIKTGLRAVCLALIALAVWLAAQALKDNWLISVVTLLLTGGAAWLIYRNRDKKGLHAVIAGSVALLVLMWCLCGATVPTVAVAAFMAGLVWLMYLNRDNRAIGRRVAVFVAMVGAAVLYFGAAVAWGDKGYLTNFPGMMTMVVLVYMMMQKRRVAGADTAEVRAGNAEKHIWQLMLGMVAALLVVLYVVVPNYLIDPNDVHYGRGSRRLSISADFDRYQASGYRYAMQDAEFMIVVAHYLNLNAGIDPLSNETHPLHASVSTGQSPVVLNDVSLPAAFLGSYGVVAYVAYFGLLALLAWLVLHHCLPSSARVLSTTTVLSKPSMWSMLAMFMWVGTTLYLFLSYMGWLPFTGRLNPGYGVDAVGEALESAILLAFMTCTTLKRE